MMLTEKLAEYFVCFYGDQDNYVSLMDELRNSNTRSSIIRSICVLIDNKQHFTKKCLSQKNLNNLFRFIQEGSSKEVIIFHRMLTATISRYELKRIREQERYLIELLDVTLLETENKKDNF
jgi:hypothetical protein